MEQATQTMLIQNLLDEIRESRKEVGKLREELGNTRAIIRDYNGLRELVQKHERILFGNEEFSRGYDSAQAKEGKVLESIRKWGAWILSAAAFVTTLLKLKH